MIFLNWKREPVTKAFFTLIENRIKECNEKLANGYQLFNKSNEEYAKYVAREVGYRDALEKLLEVVEEDLEMTD